MHKLDSYRISEAYRKLGQHRNQLKTNVFAALQKLGLTAQTTDYTLIPNYIDRSIFQLANMTAATLGEIGSGSVKDLVLSPVATTPLRGWFLTHARSQPSILATEVAKLSLKDIHSLIVNPGFGDAKIAELTTIVVLCRLAKGLPGLETESDQPLCVMPGMKRPVQQASGPRLSG